MSAYVEIRSDCGAVDPARGLDLPAGEVRRYRAEHLSRLRANNGALDDAIEACRIAVRRVSLRAEEAERCDAAWRALAQPWRLASSTRGDEVHGTGAGLGSATVRVTQ